MGMMGMGAPAPDVEVDPVVEEEAAAVGDPHMTSTSGETDDLCCETGVCKPCAVALLQVSDDYYSYYYSSLLQEDELGMGMGMMGMGAPAPDVEVDPVVEEEAAAVGDPHMTLTS